MFGVLTPLLARPLSDGSLEIISGHRRARAAEAAGLTEVPVIVRKMTDDEAVVLMVDSNLQRENITRGSYFRPSWAEVGNCGIDRT